MLLGHLFLCSFVNLWEQISMPALLVYYNKLTAASNHYNIILLLYYTSFNINIIIFLWPTACAQQIFTLCSYQNHSPSQFEFSLNSWQNVFHPNFFLLKALDVLLGCSNFQLMSDFLFTKSYQWIWLLKENLP